ncbi:MAG: type II secretion system F family protein [Eubacteriales bacterium]
MPKYQYKAVDRNNKNVKGTLFAQSEADLYQRLKDTKLLAYEINESEKSLKTYAKLKTKDLCDFARQIGTMQASGISIMKAIDIMRDRDLKPKVREVYDAIYRMVNQGNSLTQGMESCEGAFPALIINMFKAGEVSGRLEDVAAKMAHHYESENKINQKIKNAMAYPMILCFVMVAVVAILFLFILPTFFEMYTTSGTDLPLPTQILVATTDYIQANWYIIAIVLAVIGFIGNMISKVPVVKRGIDKAKLGLPQIGQLLGVIYTARFARTMSSVYSSGVPMIQAVEIAARTMGNTYIEHQFGEVIRLVQSGQSLSTALKGVEGIEKKLVSAIFIGEESGKLDDMLTSLADEYEFEANSAIERLLTFIEPCLIVVMAVVIGSIMIAVMLPMFNMYEVVA